MSNELSDQLRRLADQNARTYVAGATSIELDVARLAGRAQRRRVVRRTLVGAVAAAAAVGVGVSASAMRLPHPQPPATPTPDVTSPAPSASPTPTPTGSPVAVTPVRAHEGLPAALPMPAGLVSTTTTDWSMLQVNPDFAGTAATGTAGAWVGLPRMRYLLAPDGRLYQVPVASSVTGMLYDWVPGTSLALTQDNGGANGEPFQVVDLLTGETSSVINQRDPAAGTELFSAAFIKDGTSDLLVNTVRTTAAGTSSEYSMTRQSSTGQVLATSGWHPGGTGLLSPDGRRIVYGENAPHLVSSRDFSDLGAPQLPYPQRADACSNPQWLDSDRVLVTCTKAANGGAVELWIVPANGDAPVRVSTNLTVKATWSGHGVASALLWHEDGSGFELDAIHDDGSVTSLRTMTEAEQVVSSPLLVRAPSSTAGSSDVSRVDPLTGTASAVLTMSSELIDSSVLSGLYSFVG